MWQYHQVNHSNILQPHAEKIVGFLTICNDSDLQSLLSSGTIYNCVVDQTQLADQGACIEENYV